jgi:hypothetical protein
MYNVLMGHKGLTTAHSVTIIQEPVEIIGVGMACIQ